MRTGPTSLQSDRRFWPADPRIALTLLLSTVVLSWPAFVNGFPLVFADSGTYLRIGLELYYPWGQPITYGLFVLPLHAGLTLWPIVFAQAAIVSYVLVTLVRLTAPGAGAIGALALVATLAVATGLPWFVSQIMPDIFAPVVVLLIYMLLFHFQALALWEKLLFSALLGFATATHLSYFLLAGGLVALALLARPVFRFPFRMLVAVLAPVAVGWVVLSAATFHYNGMLTPNPNGHVFLMNRLVETGTAARYLTETCPTKPYAICAHLDEIASGSTGYLHDDNSILSRLGGPEATREESKEILQEVVRAYPSLVLELTASSAAEQLLRFGVGDGLHPYLGDWRIHQVIQEYFPGSLDAYESAQQNAGRLPVAIFTDVQRVALAVALAVAAGSAFFALRRRDDRFLALLLFTAAALFGNALITGGISGAYDRYQGRLVWLVVLVAGIGLLKQVARWRATARPAPGGTRLVTPDIPGKPEERLS